jgi:hypothetical protein
VNGQPDHGPEATTGNGRPDSAATTENGHVHATGSLSQAEQATAFLNYLQYPKLDESGDPVACFEVRLLECDINRSGFIVPESKFKKTISGYFTQQDHCLAEISRARGVSVYVTVNPVDEALSPRSPNKLTIAKNSATDADIVCLRWLFIDFDAKRKTGVSSTNEELARAVERRDLFLADHPELAESAIWGVSGNGCWCLVLLPDYPNDEEHATLIADATAAVSARYSDERVEVDLKTKNAARVMPCVGTLKCKGTHTAKRPHRPVTLDSPVRPIEPADLAGWLDRNRPAKVEPAAHGPTGSNGHPSGSSTMVVTGIADRIIKCLDRCLPAISGDDGHGKLLFAAGIGPGFDLTETDAFDYIKRYFNPRCVPEWSDKELLHKVKEAFKKNTKPLGYLRDAERETNRGSEANGNGRHSAERNGRQLEGSNHEQQSHVEPIDVEPIDVEPIDVEAIRTAASKIETFADLLRDDAFLAELASLEGQNLTEANAVVATFRDRLKSKFKAREFENAIKRFRPPEVTPGGMFDKWLINDYEDRDGFLGINESDGEGRKRFRVLCNFTGMITQEITRDDGDSTKKHLVIEAALSSGKSLHAEVPAEQYEKMEWVVQSFGSEAVIEAGRGNKDHVRAAFQRCSTRAERVTVYTHTGWRLIDDQWKYLHGRGGITRDGLDKSIQVDLSEHVLAHYELPDPPIGRARVEAVRASLAIGRLAKKDQPKSRTVAAMLLAHTYRAAIGSTKYSIQFNGATGTHKSCCAALGQQHYGPAMNYDRLPASWSDTAASLQSMTHAVKDGVIVIDDLKPSGSGKDRDREFRTADEIFQNQGNGHARRRMKSDGTMQPPTDPRGSILSTGEDRAKRKSANYRTLPVWFDKSIPEREIRGTVDEEVLTLCQRDADAGLYSAAMSAFIQWLAPQLDGVRAELPKQVAEKRILASRAGDHGRTPDIVADLSCGFDVFLRFAVEVGAISESEADRDRKTVWSGLMDAAAELRNENIEEGSQADEFIRLIVAALSSNRAYLANAKDNDVPDGFEATCGWRSELKWQGDSVGQAPMWVTGPNSPRIGWIDTAASLIYLEPESSYNAAQDMLRVRGEALPSKSSLHLQLDGTGKLAEKDSRNKAEGANRLTARKSIAGTRKTVLVLRTSEFWPKDESTPAMPEVEGEL